MKLDADIHNYYEHLVLEKMESLGVTKENDADYIADLTCLVLNQLSPRYIRFEVDMAFYLPASERRQMEMNVVNAIDLSVNYLNEHYKKEK